MKFYFCLVLGLGVFLLPFSNFPEISPPKIGAMYKYELAGMDGGFWYPGATPCGLYVIVGIPAHVVSDFRKIRPLTHRPNSSTAYTKFSWISGFPKLFFVIELKCCGQGWDWLVP